jgi:hypothetical protein
VLLVKKNGYDLALEFKQNPELKSIPIVLMWSGFIAFDHDKFVQSQADDKLEKPFDAEALRQMVRKHVPKLHTNKIAPFLSYDLPEFIETPPRVTELDSSLPKIELPMTSKPPQPQELPSTSASDFNQLARADQTPLQVQPIEIPSYNPLTHEDLDDVDDFQQVPLPGKRKSSPSLEDWSVKKPANPDPILPKSVSIPDPFSIDVSDAQIATMKESELVIPLSDLEAFEKKPNSEEARPTPQVKQTPLVKSLPQNIDPVRLEEIMREQVREVLKEIAWRVVPDIAERVVREEMQNLLKEAERLP